MLLVSALLLAACGSDSDDNVQPFAGGTRIAATGDSVLVHYTGTLDDGSEFDSSVGRDPLSFIVDSGQMVPGFNDVVRGMALGDKVAVRLEPNEAYGESNPALIGEVALANVPAGTVIGDKLFSNDGRSVTVVAIEGATVTLDANHALAGKALSFEIELVEIH